MSHNARYEILAKRADEMRRLCSNRPYLHAAKQIVDIFGEVLENIRSQDPNCSHNDSSYQYDYTQLCAYSRLLSEPQSILESGWMATHQERQVKKIPPRPTVAPQRPTVMAPRPTVIAPQRPLAPRNRDAPNDDALSARSNAPTARSFYEPLVISPTHFGDESCARGSHGSIHNTAPVPPKPQWRRILQWIRPNSSASCTTHALARCIKFDRNEYLWEFRGAEASRASVQHTVVTGPGHSTDRSASLQALAIRAASAVTAPYSRDAPCFDHETVARMIDNLNERWGVELVPRWRHTQGSVTFNPVVKYMS